VAVTDLASIQRLACQAITGTFLLLPGAALDCCLNIGLHSDYGQKECLLASVVILHGG
ncbi:hypothetical protein J6590_106008, partial [Homalodisca vitripennis]